MWWIWLLVSLLVVFLLLLSVTAALALGARRGGAGSGAVQALSRFVLRFSLTRKLALKMANRAFKSGKLPLDAVGAGLSPDQAKQAQQMLSSLSDEGREKVLGAAMEMDRADTSEERKQELMQETVDVFTEDLALGRDQRRALERAQARAARSPQSSSRPPQRKRKRKKR